LKPSFPADVARRVIDTRLEPSFLELNGILRRGEQYLSGPHSRPGNSTKIPYAFYATDVKGFPPGYFLYFDTKLPLSRVKDKLLQVLSSGRFLRPTSTESMKMIMVTWNAELEVFGRVEVTLARDLSGAIQASTKVETLVDWRLNRPQVVLGVAGQVFKLAMVLGFLAHTVHAIASETSRTKGVGWRTGPALRFLKVRRCNLQPASDTPPLLTST